MDLFYFAGLARRNWPLILLSLVLGVTTALTVTANTPPRYVATISMLVSGYDKESDVSTAYQAGILSQQRVKSYATLLTSRRVIGQITSADQVEQLRASVTAAVVPETMLLEASVGDRDPARAASLANALGAAFTRLIDQIERPTPNSTPSVKVTIVDRAQVPDAPVSPRPLLNVSLAVLLALLVAAASLVLRDRLDTTIKTRDVLQRTSDSPTLGLIGYERDARRHPLTIRARGRSSRAEAFRSLRTNLQFIGVDQRPKSLVVTSSLPKEGKTSTSANLSIALAQAGWRVLLVDGDLRRPCVSTYLGIEGAVGLTDVLIGTASLADAVQPWEGQRGLFVLPSGQIPPNPSELLGSLGMRTLLAQLADEYDVVIIDAPPLLPFTDAAALGAICDGALLVARCGKTRREQVTRAAELLSSVNARLVGTVLNFVPGKQDTSYGYESYKPVDTKSPVGA
jgi:capsular exopolysaccharide synthesis family protein